MHQAMHRTAVISAGAVSSIALIDRLWILSCHALTNLGKPPCHVKAIHFRGELSSRSWSLDQKNLLNEQNGIVAKCGKGKAIWRGTWTPDDRLEKPTCASVSDLISPLVKAFYGGNGPSPIQLKEWGKSILGIERRSIMVVLWQGFEHRSALDSMEGRWRRHSLIKSVGNKLHIDDVGKVIYVGWQAST
jgi:hypothetical protein